MAKKKKEELKEIESTTDNILLPSKIDMDSIKKELKDYVDEKVDRTFFDELDKANRKLLRDKSRRIFWKNIIIILLLLIIGFLTYLLYTNNYFDKYFNKNTPIEEKDKKEEEKEKEEEKKEESKKEEEKKEEEKKEPTLDELKKEYGSLLDNYYVSDNSIYLVDFYDGKLTNDMKKYMTLNTFNFSSLEKEEDYNIIKNDTFKSMYEKLFSDEYVAETFGYDENKVRFVKAMESYMTSEVLVRDENSIKREIKDIKVNNGEITITTIEGVVKDSKLYNIISNNEIEDYNNDTLLKYEDKLNTLNYKFKDNKLISLSK